MEHIHVKSDFFESTETVLVIGTGALACLFAAQLSRTGCPVTMTGSWQPGIDALRKNGVGLTEQGNSAYYPVDILNQGKHQKKFSYAVLLVKAHQTKQALVRVQNRLSENGSVLSLQNGLTPRNQMIEAIGEKRSISGITLCAAEQTEPGVARHNGGTAVFLGEHENAGFYRDVLVAAGFTVKVTADIQKMVWEKAILNSAANPLGAILGLKNGTMLNSPDVMNIMDGLILEACSVARAEGYTFEPMELQQKIRQILKDTADNRCSMLQDVLHNRETEIEDINGAITNLGNRHGIDTPVQNTIRNLVRSIQKEA